MRPSHTPTGTIVLQEKVIVVTGASGALGKVVVETALARGARVAAVDYAAAHTAPTPQLLQLGGVDLTDAAQAKKAIDAAASHFGKLDALVNIAGGFAFETVADGDPRTWQRMYALNVATALNASLAFTPLPEPAELSKRKSLPPRSPKTSKKSSARRAARR